MDEGREEREGKGAYAGTKRSSNFTNSFINSINLSPSQVGKAIRAADLFSRFIFISGRNSVNSPRGFLYAFMPSKHSNA